MKVEKLQNLLNLNINLNKTKKADKQINKLVKGWNIKGEVEILLQTNMNSINNGWDSTRLAETPYFHCGLSGQNENDRKR